MDSSLSWLKAVRKPRPGDKKLLSLCAPGAQQWKAAGSTGVIVFSQGILTDRTLKNKEDDEEAPKPILTKELQEIQKATWFIHN